MAAAVNPQSDGAGHQEKQEDDRQEEVGERTGHNQLK